MNLFYKLFVGITFCTTFTIMIPQIIYLALTFIAFLISAHEHGKPKTGKNNFWVSATAYILSMALLYWGGFFDNLLN